MDIQVRHMVRLVDDLLEVSRITGGKIELRKELVQVATIVGGAVETSRPLIEAAGHQLAITPPEPLTLDADPVRLTQVISNLLNNAAKYTPEGGQIWLTARREGGDVVLSVRDNGLGIPADMLPRLFDTFAQVDGTYARTQGDRESGSRLPGGSSKCTRAASKSVATDRGRGANSSCVCPSPYTPRRYPRACFPHRGRRSGRCPRGESSSSTIPAPQPRRSASSSKAWDSRSARLTTGRPPSSPYTSSARTS